MKLGIYLKSKSFLVRLIILAMLGSVLLFALYLAFSALESCFGRGQVPDWIRYALAAVFFAGLGWLAGWMKPNLSPKDETGRSENS